MKNKVLSLMILMFIGLGLPFFVLLKNIYPDLYLRLNETREFGAGFVPITYNDKEYVVVSMPENHPFSEIDVTLNFSENSLKDDLTMSLRKGQLVSLYPAGEPINDEETLKKYLFQDNPDNIPNGALYSKSGQAFVVSRGKYYPIISPAVFETMGYKWDMVTEIDSNSFSKLQPAENIKYMSVHPDGTILRSKDGQFYLVWEGKKLPIKSEDLLANVWKTYYFVNITSAEPDYLETCQVSAEETEEAYCRFIIAGKKIDSLGGNYIISLSPAVLSSVTNGQADLKTAVTFNKSYLKYAVGRIINKLYVRYAGYFF